MAKIPFDIKYRDKIESGEYKVVDNDNHNIRIICWDKKSEKKYGYCIVGLVEFGPNHEESTYYTIDGKARLKDKHPCLFLITPEPELNDFEKAVANVCFDWQNIEPENRIMTDSVEDAIKEDAAKLLAIARKEALKDLPRWKKWENGACGNGRGIPLALVVRGLNGYELVDALGIQGEKYIMLSDLEKLPGFKEDSHE